MVDTGEIHRRPLLNKIEELELALESVLALAESGLSHHPDVKTTLQASARMKRHLHSIKNVCEEKLRRNKPRNKGKRT